MRRERLGVLAVLASAAGYGFLSVLLKLALEAGARPLPIVVWRFTLAALVVWGVLALGGRPPPPRNAFKPLVGLGALYAVNATAFTVALQWVPASTATLVFYAYPVLVVLLAGVFLDERVTRRGLAAMSLAVLGCILTAGAGARGGHPLGIALVLLATASLAVYIVLGRSLLERLPARGSAAVILSATAVVAGTVALATGDWELGGGRQTAGLVFLIALVSTAFPVTLFIVGLKRIGAGRAALYSTLEPVVTVAAAWLLLGERISAIQYVGGILILAGVSLLRAARPLPAAGRPTPLDAP